MRHSSPPQAAQDHGSQTAVSGETEQRGHLTLEFRDNPFESLVRNIERLIERDPKEALRLLKTTLSDKLFTAPRELARLGDKLDETMEKLRETREQTFTAAPGLASAFTREAFALPAPTPETGHNRPAPQFAPAANAPAIGLAA